MKRARTLKFICTAALAGITPSLAAAQLLNVSAPADSMPNFSMLGAESIWPSIGQLGGALIFVLALIWGTTWVAKRLMKGRWSGAGADRMRVLERLHLAPKKSVEIVSVGKRILVLGVTENQIGLLTELDPAELTQPNSATAGASGLSAGRQRALLNEARHKLNELFRAARPADVEAAPSR